MDQGKSDWNDREDLLKRCITAEERAKLMESELGQASRYQKAVQELQAENAIMQGRIQKLTQEVSVKNQQIDELFKKWENSDLNQMGLENLNLAQKLSGREDKILKLESELQVLYSDYTAKYQKIIDELFKKWEMNEQSLKDNQELLKRISSRDEQTEKLEHELRRMNAEFNQKYQKVLDLAVRVQESGHSFAAMKDDLDALKKGQVDLNRQIQKLEQLKSGEYGELAEIIKERVNNHLKNCLHAIEKESLSARDRLQQDFTALAVKHQEKEMQVEKMNQRLEMFKDELGFLRESLESRSKEASADAPAKEAGWAQALEQLQRGLESARGEWQMERAALLEQVRELRGQLESRRQEQVPEQGAGGAQARLDAVSEKLAGLESGMAGMREDVLKSLEKWASEKQELLDRIAAAPVHPEPVPAPEPASPEIVLQEAAEKPFETFVEAPPSKLPPGMSEFIMDDIQNDLAGLGTGEVAENNEVPTADAASPEALATKKLRIIVAEHNPESLEQLKGSLLNEGCEALAASDGQTVINMARGGGADLIVMNIAISDVDSYTVSHELAKAPDTERIPIILIASNPESAQIFKEDPLNSIKGYLYKPFSVKEFMAAVRGAVSA